MNIFSLFSGIGAFEKALDNLKIPYELTGFSEIDKYAVKSYCAIHNVDESKNYGDITKIDENALPKNIDLITYGFPCQDISLAGKQKGLFNNDGTQTRSGLFFEALRIIEATKPRIAIAENVKNLTSKKFAEQFKIVLASLEKAGYNNYWQVLNAKDYGIPQNRERVFIISIRKDIDTGCFKFPEGFPLELRLKDMLEAEVDEKFYLSKKSISYICATGTKNFHYEPEIDLEIARPLTSTMHKAHRASQDNYFSETFLKDDVKATIKDGKPFIAVKQATKQGYTEAVEGDSINLEQPNSKTRRGRVGHGVAQTITTSPAQAVVEPVIKQVGQLYGTEKEGVFEKSERHYLSEGIAPTLTSATASEKVIEPSLRIRKLTPKECFRLMGFDDADYEKAEKVNSNTQLYKQAGNSIVVPVVEYIIKELIACGALESEGTIQQDTSAPTQPILTNTVTFSAKLTAAELSSLNHYMKTRKIEYQIV